MWGHRIRAPRQQRPPPSHCSKTTVPTSASPSLGTVDYERDHGMTTTSLGYRSPHLPKIRGLCKTYHQLRDATGMTAAPRAKTRNITLSVPTTATSCEPMMTRRRLRGSVQAHPSLLSWGCASNQILDNENQAGTVPAGSRGVGPLLPPKNHSNRAGHHPHGQESRNPGGGYYRCQLPRQPVGRLPRAGRDHGNILLPWRLDPNRSAYRGLTGAKFDFERHPWPYESCA
jgi:hypothetical protein